jgi:hypothetical protein
VPRLSFDLEHGARLRTPGVNSALSHPGRNTTLFLQNAPDIHEVLVVDIEHPVRNARQAPRAQARQVQPVRVPGRTRAGLTPDVPIRDLKLVNKIKSDLNGIKREVKAMALSTSAHANWRGMTGLATTSFCGDSRGPATMRSSLRLQVRLISTLRPPSAARAWRHGLALCE